MLVVYKWQKGVHFRTSFQFYVHGNSAEHRGKAEKTLKIEYLL